MSHKMDILINNKLSQLNIQLFEQGATVPDGAIAGQGDEGIVLLAMDAGLAFDKTVISKNYDIGTLQYLSESGFGPNYVVFNSDGTKMITAQDNGVGELANIELYNLSTPWDAGESTLADSFTPSVVSDTVGDHVDFVTIGGDNDDILYIRARLDDGSVTLLRYNLTDSFDISNQSLQESEDVERSSNDGFSFFDDFKFSPDGTKVYFTMQSQSTNLVQQFNLSTPWVVSSRTLTFTLTESDLPDNVGHLGDGANTFEFLGDGTKVLLHCSQPEAVLFTLDTAYDWSSYSSIRSQQSFTPQSPQIYSLIETPLVADFPTNPSYMEIVASDINYEDVTLDIHYYNADILQEIKVYLDTTFQDEEFVESIDPSTQQYTFNNLDPERAYNFRMEGVDPDGNVLFQDNVDVTTQSDNLDFTTEDQQTTEVTLSWTNDYSDIAGYNLLVDDVQDNGAVISLATAQAGYTIDGLSQGTSYDVRVQALDSDDNLLFEDTTTIVTTAGAITSLNEDFEALALGATPSGWQQSSGSDYSWEVTDQRAEAGSKSLGSDPAIGNNETAAIEVTVELDAESTLAFDYLPSCENNYDFFKFYVDGVLEFEQSGVFNEPDSGDTLTFFNHSQVLAAGTYTFKFEFAKDSSAAEYDDRCYIDNITTTPT